LCFDHPLDQGIEASMPEYRRWFVPGGTYFFTVVTQDRVPIFRNPSAVRLLGKALRLVRARHPFETNAIVVLPDHIHCVWSLPRGDTNYSGRWRWIKGAFTEQWLSGIGNETNRSDSRLRKGERGVWQRRFWEHLLQDETDLERHVDYIHYNPVKHGYSVRPGDWPWSSFRRHVRFGQYPEEWGATEPKEPVRRPRE
jgi:REP-associated tyrosine transposase